MEERAVNIKLCDRTYPMKVRAEDEAQIRQAGKLINDRVRSYSEQFGIGDQQDLLAMVAFDCLVESSKATNHTEQEKQAVHAKLQDIVKLLDSALV